MAARAPRRAALLRRRQPLFRAGAWRRAAAGVAGVAGAVAARVHRPAARATVMKGGGGAVGGPCGSRRAYAAPPRASLPIRRLAGGASREQSSLVVVVRRWRLALHSSRGSVPAAAHRTYHTPSRHPALTGSESVGPSVPERRQSIVYVHGAFARRVAGRGALGGACGAWRGVCCGAVCPLCWLQPQPAASVFVLLNLCGWPHFGTGFFLSFLTSSGTTEKFSRRVALCLSRPAHVRRP